MKQLEVFLIEQIESEIKTIEGLLITWSKPSHDQLKILGVLLGKAYGYLNTLKQIAFYEDPQSLKRLHAIYQRDILKLDMIK
jgi:hypothetical protein